MFESKDGEPYKRYNQALTRELKKLKIKGSMHKFRHTFASRLVQRDVNLSKIQQLLGHQSLEKTMIYAHIRNEDLSYAVNVLNDDII